MYMGMHLDAQTKLNIVLDLIESKKSIKRYASEIGIARSTLTNWVNKYYANINQEVQMNGLPAIIDITNEAMDIAIPQDKPTDDQIIVHKDNSTTITSTSTNSCFEQSNLGNNTIKLSTGKFTLEFDISNLKEIVRAFND